jgi:hypothetical protein
MRLAGRRPRAAQLRSKAMLISKTLPVEKTFTYSHRKIPNRKNPLDIYGRLGTGPAGALTPGALSTICGRPATRRKVTLILCVPFEPNSP